MAVGTLPLFCFFKICHAEKCETFDFMSIK